MRLINGDCIEENSECEAAGVDMRDKIIEILKRNDSPVSWWRGVPMSKFEEVADEILLLRSRIVTESVTKGDLVKTDWAGIVFFE